MELVEVRALIVGGASGMARATAEQLAASGAAVAILDRPGSAGPEVAAALDAPFVACDVTDFEATETAVNEAAARLGGINVVVNTAGGAVAIRTLGRSGPHPLDSFRRVIDLNLVASFNIARLAADLMSTNDPNADGERGVIINTTSIAAFEGQIGQVAYASAKAGIVGMTFTMARDLGSLGIRVNAIAPSLFSTGLTANVPEEFAARLTEDAAFPRRMGHPTEYARLAIAVIENPMLNAGTIRLDGGQRFGPK
ncbi:SDR family NAD(P)-dependent oxidoreductase [uncultured Jatrophihabitans sp.]|uniref:SDR family NAD(P)-dependent oxidoreductase n=1 Tax=uncultured Jatrophihabitans sp. TaxID=1610747 RepID=UPI0035CA82BC